MQKYKYEPVSEEALEVRFLILLPGEREDPIQGLLLKQCLTKKYYPIYEASSYTWGSAEDPMEVSIRTTDMREACSLFPDPNFEARIRCRTPRKRRTSFFDHFTRRSTVQLFEKVFVTRSLGQALPYLRFRDKPRILWVDAICVNQKDLPERSRQVQRMADVYRLASRAVVWLGEGSETSQMAIDTSQTRKKYRYEFDPRTFPEELEKRGVKLQDFILV